MESEKVRFADLLDRDLSHKGINQADLPRMLTEDTEPPITEAAISMWKKRNSVPPKRLRMLIEIFGPDSELAKAHAQGALETKTPPRQDANRNHDSIQYSKREFANMLTQVDQILQPQFAGVKSSRIRYSRVEEGVKEALPPEMQDRFEREIRIGAISLRFDYISENAVIELASASSGSISPNAYKSLFKLAVADRLYGFRHKPRRYGLILITEGDDESPHGLSRIQFEAELMGLQLTVVDSFDKAARVIQKWETDPMKDDFR